MFLIAGVSPKTKILDHHPRRCPTCRLSQAYLKRIDHYFNLFFIPLIRVKKGEPVLVCERCEQAVNDVDRSYDPIQERQVGTCGQCGQAVENDFTYCPHCGKLQ